MTTATATDPFVRRDELEAEIETAREVESRHGARMDEIDAELEDVSVDLLAAYEEAARTGTDEIPARCRQRESDLQAERAPIQQAREGAARVIQQSRDALKQLLHLHFEVFAEECEAKTQEAIEKLRALEDPYSEAWAAWNEAARSWQPLVDAAGKVQGHNEAAAPQSLLGRVPSWPLSSPRSFRSLAPRPPEIKVAGEQTRQGPRRGIRITDVPGE